MVNETGRNGYDNGTVPPDDVLRAALTQYAREQLPIKRRLARLAQEFNYHIKKSKLKNLNAKFNIPTVRKPPAEAISTTLVCEKMANNIHRRQGPSTIKNELALEGVLVPRSVVRSVMRDNDPMGASLRNPRLNTRQAIVRKVLTALGIWDEMSVDGHEKLGPFALQMGQVGFHIYGMRDKWAGKILHLVCVSNSRHAMVVGHIYIDFVVAHGMIPVQVTFDGGSETPEMKAIQEALRRAFAPEMSFDEYPPHISLPSVRNVTIENLWSRWLKHVGWTLQTTLMEGKTNGFFNAGDNIDINLFQWLWSQVIQAELDHFKDYWNCHRVRSQPNKEMPSGGTPNDFFATPQDFGGSDMGIPVDVDIAEALRAQIPMSREEAFRFVEDEFKVVVEDAYADIGCPKLTIQTGWAVFSQLKIKLRNIFASNYE